MGTSKKSEDLGILDAKLNLQLAPLPVSLSGVWHVGQSVVGRGLAKYCASYMSEAPSVLAVTRPGTWGPFTPLAHALSCMVSLPCPPFTGAWHGCWGEPLRGDGLTTAHDRGPR